MASISIVEVLLAAVIAIFVVLQFRRSQKLEAENKELLSALMDDIENTTHVGNTGTGIGNLVRLRETRNVGTVPSQNVKLNIWHYTPHDANKDDTTHKYK